MHREGEWLVGTRLDETHHVGPRHNRVVVDLHDLVPAAQPRTLRGQAEQQRPDASREQLHDGARELVPGRGVTRDVDHDRLRASGDLETQLFRTAQDLLDEVIPGLE